jgi:hypothetical protein
LAEIQVNPVSVILSDDIYIPGPISSIDWQLPFIYITSGNSIFKIRRAAELELVSYFPLFSGEATRFAFSDIPGIGYLSQLPYLVVLNLTGIPNGPDTEQALFPIRV